MIVDLLGPVYPYRGGIAHYTTRLAQEFNAQGHNCRVINLTRQYPDALFPGTSQTDTTDGAFVVPSDRLVDSVDPLSWARTARSIARRRTELLVVQWWHSYFTPSFGSIAAAARAQGTEVVYLCHNVLPHEAKPWDRALARVAYTVPNRFVVHAQSEATRLRSIVPRAEVSVHPHPLYDLFVPAEPISRQAARATLGVREPRVVLFFGLIRPYKGVDVLLDALRDIPADQGIRTIIAGECYDDPEPYRAQLAKHGLADRVTLEMRYIPNDEVGTFMAAADVVVLPYRNASQSGIVQIAYACGRPVITTRVGGLPDVVEEGVTGLLVPPSDPPALAAALRRFFDEGLGPRLEAGVEEASRRFTWASMVETLAPTPKPRKYR